jgi:hypothetical protein
MGKSTPQAPAAPDPAAVAAAQGQQNRESAIAQANLNRIDQFTPQGSVTYAQTGTNSDGTPKYAQTQTYSPGQQAVYDQQNQVAQALGGLATDNIAKVSTAQSTPFNYDSATPLQTSVGGNLPAIQYGATADPIQKSLDLSGATPLPGTGDFSADAARVANSVYGQATSRLDPRFAQSDSDLASSLANQGISNNSDAYRREMDNAARAKNDAYTSAQNSAQQAGSDEQSRIFGLALQAHQTGVADTTTAANFANSAQNQGFQQGQQTVATANEAQNQGFNQQLTNANLNNAGRTQQEQEMTYLRNLPLNDIAALLGTGGGVQNPNFQPVAQVGVAAPDYQGAVYANYNAQNQQYNQQLQAQSAGLGSIFGAAASMAPLVMSDVRLKHTIRKIGKLANGLATYVFSYLGSSVRHFGVMAQEALQIVPDAVFTVNGYHAVDYRKVW